MLLKQWWVRHVHKLIWTLHEVFSHKKYIVEAKFVILFQIKIRKKMVSGNYILVV